LDVTEFDNLVTAVTSAERAVSESARVGYGMTRPTWPRPKQENVMTIKAEIAVEAEIRALAENEIDAVSGGVKFHDLVIVKYVDKSTPELATAAASAPAGK
jgi:hypothetical protein